MWAKFTRSFIRRSSRRKAIIYHMLLYPWVTGTDEEHTIPHHSRCLADAHYHGLTLPSAMVSYHTICLHLVSYRLISQAHHHLSTKSSRDSHLLDNDTTNLGRQQPHFRQSTRLRLLPFQRRRPFRMLLQRLSRIRRGSHRSLRIVGRVEPFEILVCQSRTSL